MKRLSVGLVLMLLCTLSIFAQNKVISVSGRVVESDSKEPAAQATVQLLSLPDSAYAAGIASSNKGWFTLPKVKAGKYLLKISYIGFRTKFVPVQLSNNVPEKKMGNIALEPDAVMLSEAVITGTAPEVTVKEDTLEYNSTAYRTPEGAMLEELVKKLPGAEIDDDGNVKINGKEVKKIMVDGKEFFGGDVKTGLKNLPVDMVDKLKTYDKKSDLARITGIDDGEEETVLDLTVKKGMNQGWFGNVDLAGGTEDRYMGRAMINRFYDKTQFSIIGSANNVNDQGFSGGGGELGRRNEDKAYSYAVVFLKMTFAINLVMSVALFLSRGMVINIYDFDQETNIMLANTLAVYAIYMLPKMFTYVLFCGILRSGGDTRFCMLLDLLGVWVIGVPLAFLGVLVFHLPLHIIVAMVFFEEWVKLYFSFKRFKSKKWAHTLID